MGRPHLLVAAAAVVVVVTAGATGATSALLRDTGPGPTGPVLSGTEPLPLTPAPIPAPIPSEGRTTVSAAPSRSLLVGPGTPVVLGRHGQCRHRPGAAAAGDRAR